MSDQPASRLLVVDDEPALMTALRNTLRDEGYVVHGVTSGAEAIEALRAGSFDLVLTDLLMPKMDGIALLREAFVIDPTLVGIVMTGHGSIPTAVEAMKSGAIDYVLKPFKLNTLLPTIERALAMRRLRAKNLELERRVRERTTELEAANRELEAFCYSVSHDLRTPLRAVSGLVDILVEHHSTGLTPEIRRLVALIRDGAGQMEQLISDLLAFSRLGRHPLALRTVELEPLCLAVFEELQNERAGRNVELRLESLPAVSGDPALLRQVFVNLLSNALKYTRPRSAAVITVGVAPAKEGEKTPVCFVRDNGVGFDLKHAENLFGVFQRLHHTHEFEGTGVGLATVRRIIERHGGRIWAEATPDQGATFYFTLPSPAAS